MRRLFINVLSLLFAAQVCFRASGETNAAIVAGHRTNVVEGWTVLVNERLLGEDKTRTEEALELLGSQLKEIAHVVPAPAVARLREVTLWFSPEYPGVRPTAEYHPSACWLREHGRDPRMARGIEFTDIRSFKAEMRRMPNFALHELAHAYHDRVLPSGFGNEVIKAAYERARTGKSYDKVERRFVSDPAAKKTADRAPIFERAYAMTSTQEYFAECSEAYFSRNDFFPFTRAELQQHDPKMFALLGEVWSNPEKARPVTEEKPKLPIYQQTDFGPALFWTVQVAPSNIAYKGIAVRLDDGPGGVSQGRAWMVYDHDTLRVAAASTGSFIDWRGVAFDGSHQTHPKLTGEHQLVNPPGPGWANANGEWSDPRVRGRDGLPYGPLPRGWAHYEGLYLSSNKVVLAMTVGGSRVLESPGWIASEDTPVFTRTLNASGGVKPLLLRVAPHTHSVELRGDGELRTEDGMWVAELPVPGKARLFISRGNKESLQRLVKTDSTSLDLEPLTHGSPSRWPQELTTAVKPGRTNGAFVIDTLALPEKNPWQSWMRPGGFDFLPDGRRAAVCTWNGDVWIVDGVTSVGAAPLHWRRIASGLFQALGVKVRGGDIFVCCRDQIVRLRDLNRDGESDFLESFNSDHQVTEHFHEFAMDLQTDAAGNFYYAKGARHALPAIVPQHGTLLRVSADGRRTDIVANGFRAPNGVCLNDDGTFFVTDQEGHWTPKNRINRVHAGGFYGNMFGYTDVTNSADSAMEQPMVWITNAKDRSPAELVWVPTNTWGRLGGSLLSISYGMGKIFIVPHEQVAGVWQGAVCELPGVVFPTGVMRGRFGNDGALYTCGLFGWAGNAAAAGGFYRVRLSGKPSHVPIGIHARHGGIEVTFSDPIDQASVNADAFALKVWSLKRSANYGSNHYNEHRLPITGAHLNADLRTASIDIPELEPTQCYELNLRLVGANGGPVERSLHGTIHRLGDLRTK